MSKRFTLAIIVAGVASIIAASIVASIVMVWQLITLTQWAVQKLFASIPTGIINISQQLLF